MPSPKTPWEMFQAMKGNIEEKTGNQDQHMVDELYVGKKAGLRPVYDKLIAEGQKMGKDVALVICKTYSSLRSKSLYAPVGNPRFTHRIRIKDVSEVDAEVLTALQSALENNRP